jgi:hypothetical protein
MRNNLISKQNVIEVRLNEQQALLEKQLLDQQKHALERQAAQDIETDKLAAAKQQQRIQQLPRRRFSQAI